MPSKLALFALILAGIFLRLATFDAKWRTPDETYYRGFAIVINEQGLVAGTRALLRDYNSEAWRWMNPPPSRIGFIFLNAMSQKYMRDISERAGAYVSLVASCISLIFVAGIAYKVLPYWGVVLSVALAAASPFSLALSRRAWTDSLMELLAACMLWGALHITKSKNVYSWAGLLFFATAAYSVLVKESSFLAIALFAFWPAIEFLRIRSWNSLTHLATLSLLAAMTGAGFLAWVLGGPEQLFSIYRHIREAVPNADYAKTYQDGPWYDFYVSMFILAPGFCLISIASWLAFIFGGAWRLQANSFAQRSIATGWLVLILFTIAASAPLYFKNLRYFSPLFCLLPILAAYPIGILLESIPTDRHMRRSILAFMLLLIFSLLTFDFFNYNRIIVRPDCQDLNLKMIQTCIGLAK